MRVEVNLFCSYIVLCKYNNTKKYLEYRISAILLALFLFFLCAVMGATGIMNDMQVCETDYICVIRQTYKQITISIIQYAIISFHIFPLM